MKIEQIRLFPLLTQRIRYAIMYTVGPRSLKENVMAKLVPPTVAVKAKDQEGQKFHFLLPSRDNVIVCQRWTIEVVQEAEVEDLLAHQICRECLGAMGIK